MSATLDWWWEDFGVGYFSVPEKNPYDKAYFEKYVGYAKTDMGRELTRLRVALVTKYAGDGPVVDIGIGCGQFVETRGISNTFGYDVNPEGVRWLLDRGAWWDPYAYDPEHATCWDSLEHMKRPGIFTRCVRKYLFLSIPIFENKDHVLRSKHFRTDEHFWYFTRRGLLQWMRSHSFKLVEENRMEEELGREDIGTFVFERCDLQNSDVV